MVRLPALDIDHNEWPWYLKFTAMFPEIPYRYMSNHKYKVCCCYVAR